MNTLVKQATILAATAALTIATPAFAEEEFSALQGVSAVRMSTADLATTEGKSFTNFIGGTLNYFISYPGFSTTRAADVPVPGGPAAVATCVTTSPAGAIAGVGLC